MYNCILTKHSQEGIEGIEGIERVCLLERIWFIL